MQKEDESGRGRGRGREGRCRKRRKKKTDRRGRDGAGGGGEMTRLTDEEEKNLSSILVIAQFLESVLKRLNENRPDMLMKWQGSNIQQRHAHTRQSKTNHLLLLLHPPALATFPLLYPPLLLC
eukprot:745768-Hanusia_phi.AAC.1